MNRALSSALSLLPLLTGLPLVGCKPYVIEYRNRPGYYSRLVDEPLLDRVQLDDGTIIVYDTDDGSKRDETDPDKPLFKIREEREDGSVVLRALMPEHVLANTLNCLHGEEYQLLWDQMLAEQTKLAYDSQGQGYEEFAAFFQKHRNELAKTLNRMLLGIAAHEVVIEDVGGGVTVLRFWPQIAQQFRFRRVSVIREGYGLKLLLID
jgi:hypothetical protein